MDTKDIYHLLADHFDIIYFSACKLGFAKDGIITSKDPKYTKELMEFIRSTKQRLRRQPVISIDYGSV